MFHIRFVGRLVAVIGGLILILLAIGALMPRHYRFDTTAKINAPAAALYPWVADLGKWQEWTSFSPEINSTLKLEFGATRSGTDASMSWTDLRGHGKLWIVNATPNQSVEYKVLFGSFPEMTSTIRFEESPSGETTVIWESEGDLPQGPFYGWFGMYYSDNLKTDYLRNLERLKTLVEGRKVGAASN